MSTAEVGRASMDSNNSVARFHLHRQRVHALGDLLAGDLDKAGAAHPGLKLGQPLQTLHQRHAGDSGTWFSNAPSSGSA